ncbi:uncharacterized protein P884DRAFT_267320 [Thermothelomyces heterothallicus CBS 202.75]|uniref:uncharacterized protein n=1 Tax=Thermothelomyces heterothallicus CBS 202.75 TaxID=1149848 RepID=UPI0037429C2A
MSSRSGSNSNSGSRSRFNSEPSGLNNLEYDTVRGSLSARVVADQAQRSGDPRDTGRSRYPRGYGNEEGHPPNTRRPFADHERRRRENLYEVPVGEPPYRFDNDRRSATLRQVQNAEHPHPNDRGRVVEHPPNDPGPHRAVMAADPNNRDRPARGPIGVISHPPDNPRGFERARLGPDSSASRAQDREYFDHRDSNASWPPRGQSSETLSRMETNQQSGRGGQSGGKKRR